MTAPTALARDRSRGGYKDRLKDGAHAVLDPAVRGLVAVGLKPDHFTIAGLLLSVVAALAFYDGESRVAAWFLIAGGLCDILDGQVARVGNQATRFGAFLDSTLDRLAESVVLLGLAGFYASNLLGLYAKSAVLMGQVVRGEIDMASALVILNHPAIEGWAWLTLTLIAIAALVGSFMVSYTRARAEGLGLECKVGWFERPERVVLLILAGLIHTYWSMSIAVTLLAVLSFFTAGQRMVHVWKVTRPAGSDSDTTEA